MTIQSVEEATSDIRTMVRQRYGEIAERTTPAQASSCCGPSNSQAAASSGGSCCGSDQPEQFSQVVKLYEASDVIELPPEVTSLSLGCGDPITLAALQPGQIVLDLGSGGGIDCFLAAKRVGPGGRVIGVDMTPAMLDKARANKARLGAQNVEFRLGEIEHLPVEDQTVDVIISNCVINLSPDKPQVFSEAFRVLKPGGRLAVSDIVTDGPLPEAIKKDLSAWAGCVAGAWEAKDYTAAITAAGFVDVQLTPVYLDRETVDEAVEQLDLGEALDTSDDALYRAVFSARVTARKP